MARRQYQSGTRRPQPFDLDGVTFNPAGGLDLLSLSELGKVAHLDIASPQGAAVIAQIFEDLLGPDEYPGFKAHVKARVTSPTVLMQILMDAIEDIADFPTQLPSDSPDGQTTTATTLRVVSSSGVTEETLTPEREAQLRESVAAG